MAMGKKNDKKKDAPKIDKVDYDSAMDGFYGFRGMVNNYIDSANKGDETAQQGLRAIQGNMLQQGFQFSVSKS